jgi:hypothetical protein
MGLLEPAGRVETKWFLFYLTAVVGILLFAGWANSFLVTECYFLLRGQEKVTKDIFP